MVTLATGDTSIVVADLPGENKPRTELVSLSLRENLVEQKVDHHAGHGDVHPDGPGPAGDFFVPFEVALQRTGERDDDEGQNHDRPDQVGKENRQVDGAEPGWLEKT